MTRFCAQFFGWNAPEESYGKTDFDVPSKLANGAAEFIKIDHLVRSSKKKFTSIEFLETLGGWKGVLVEKKILPDGHLFCQAIEVEKTPLIPLTQKLANYSKKNNNNVWLLSEDYPNMNLSARQQQCLFYTIQGKTAKEIGAILNLSPRTIESYIEQIKNVLNCYSKSALVEKAFAEGFAYFVPASVSNIAII